MNKLKRNITLFLTVFIFAITCAFTFSIEKSYATSNKNETSNVEYQVAKGNPHIAHIVQVDQVAVLNRAQVALSRVQVALNRVLALANQVLALANQAVVIQSQNQVQQNQIQEVLALNQSLIQQ
ncbi:hypothetical protein AAIB48_08085 [Paraclostridium benzoelyticum]|uniref:hypothetical protein n=1 Tax=Paraclostridium benzoelyticum TaxID=1629550 RepID=UPI0031CCE695